MNNEYPRLERGPRIEVPRPRDGRPGYAWVEGWIVKYSETRESVPCTYCEARELFKKAKA